MKKNEKSEEYIAKFAGLIKVTVKENVPQTLFEKIIKDADYYHLLSEEYSNSCQDLRKEWENTEGKSFSDIEWSAENLDFLKNKHRFYTDFAKETAELTRSQILQQASTTILSQANQRPQAALSLLG